MCSSDLSSPVMLVPDGATPNGLRNVVIAWNGSREAARALRDAMPLIEAAEQVEILVVDPPNDLPISREITRMLVRRGIKVQLHERMSAGTEVEAVIIEEAGLDGFDLLVMGAYGHSRTRERVLGGATRTIFDSMTVPVLMCH